MSVVPLIQVISMRPEQPLLDSRNGREAAIARPEQGDLLGASATLRAIRRGVHASSLTISNVQRLIVESEREFVA